MKKLLYINRDMNRLADVLSKLHEKTNVRFNDGRKPLDISEAEMDSAHGLCYDTNEYGVGYIYIKSFLSIENYKTGEFKHGHIYTGEFIENDRTYIKGTVLCNKRMLQDINSAYNKCINIEDLKETKNVVDITPKEQLAILNEIKL
jgi:hypothetical protein